VSQVASMDARISVDPRVCSGKPCIRGTRIMVRNVIGMFAGGYTLVRILQEYPELTNDDVTAALQYASDVVDGLAVV
jgi:uncharacterized protein (DUF433 family)